MFLRTVAAAVLTLTLSTTAAIAEPDGFRDETIQEISDDTPENTPENADEFQDSATTKQTTKQFSSTSYCFAQTHCFVQTQWSPRFSHTISCAVNASANGSACTFEAVQGQYVRCDGWNSAGQLAHFFSTCY